MKDIILKPGTFLKDTKTTNTKNIPGQSVEDFVVGLLKNPTCCAKYVTLTKGVVTQSGSITSAVTLNQPAGEITTVSATIAGLVVVQVDNIVAGSCSISLAGVVSNTGTVTIGFGIF
jgi:hypothetical protein